MDNVALRPIKYSIPLLKYRCFGSFPRDHVPTLPNDTFAIINIQPSNMQGEHWILIAKLRHQLYLADFLGRKDYNFLRKNYKRMIKYLATRVQFGWEFCVVLLESLSLLQD